MDWELVPQDFSFLILCRSTDGTEQERPRGAAPSPRSGAAAVLCWSSREEISHAQGKRNLSKTVSTERGHQRADRRKHNHRQLANLIAWTTALSNSMKLSHAHGATQEGQVMVERSDRMRSTGEGNGKPLQYSCLENPMNSRKRQNDRIPKEELPGSLGAQYATGDQWRNNSRKNEGMEPKQKQYSASSVLLVGA